MAKSIDTTFRTEADNLKWLLALLNSYGMYHNEISAISNVGFNIHVLNDLTENTNYMVRQAKRETFVSTARYMDSLYKHARELGITPTFARPAKIDLVMSIDERDFLANATADSNNVLKYTIGKESFISLGNFIYSFDYDIEIRLEYGVNNDQYLTAKYVVGNVFNPISELAHYNIKVVRQVSPTGGWVYQLYLTLQQYAREIMTKEFGDRDNAIFKVSTKRKTDQIAGLQVFHIPLSLTNARGPVELDQKMFFESSRTSVDSIFLKYESFNSLTLIHKSQDGGFRPQETDKIQSILYVTEGDVGNFQFSTLGGTNIRFNSKKDAVLKPQIDLLGGSSRGGVSYYDSLEMLRKRIITKKSTRNSIITENDLAVILNALDLPNNYYVIKNRNDIIKVFNVFTNLTFKSNGLTFSIPTNTLHVDWNYRNPKYAIDLGDLFYQMKVSYATSNAVYQGELLTEDEIKAKSEMDLRYRIPFIVVFNRNKNYIRFYSDYMDEMMYTDTIVDNTNLPYTYICNWVKFTKKEDGDPYEVLFHLRTNLAGTVPQEKMARIVNEQTLETADTGYLEVYFSLSDKKGNLLYRKQCVQTQYDIQEEDDPYFVYKLKLVDKGADNILIKDDKIRLIDPNNPSDFVWVPISDLDGKIEVFTPTKRSPGSHLLDTDRGLVNTFKFECDLIKNESSNYKIQHSALDNDNIRIFYVPMVGYDFYKDHKEIYLTAAKEKDYLSDYLQQFQGEFSYSLKYVNTYGLSDLYTIGLDKETRYLNNTILHMKFLIELKMGSSLTESQLNFSVSKYLESIDFFTGEDFHISKLYEFLYTLYPNDIHLVQFQSINNLSSNDQFIKIDNTKINNRTIVERLNLPIVYDSISKTFSYKITWEFIKKNVV